MASAYVLPAPVPSSSISRSTKSAGLGSYVPDLGLTNMVHASESCSSHCASPRCDLVVCVCARGGCDVSERSDQTEAGSGRCGRAAGGRPRDFSILAGVSRLGTRGAGLIGSRTLVCACLLPRFQTTWSALVPGRTLYALWTVTSNRYLSAFHPATLLSMPSTIAADPAHASLASAPDAGKGRRGGRLRDCSRACDARDCLSRGRRCSSRCATGKAVTHRASRARCGAATTPIRTKKERGAPGTKRRETKHTRPRSVVGAMRGKRRENKPQTGHFLTRALCNRTFCEHPRTPGSPRQKSENLVRGAHQPVVDRI